MNRRTICLACALLVLCVSSSAALAQRVRKSGSVAKKKSDSGVTAKPKPNLTAATDLNVTGEQPSCYDHSARVRIGRMGPALANSFYVSLKIYKNNSVVESIEQLVAPFSNTYQHIYFTTQTKLLRMDAAEKITCKFTADAHNQISESSENNNVVDWSAPVLGFGPHE